MEIHNCSVCELQNKNGVPEWWCPHCEEFLCAQCGRQHQVQKATRDHTIISYDDYCKLPPFVLNVQHFCEEHQEKYQYYCRSHKYPLCKKCQAIAHKTCDGTPDIDEIIHNIKTSAMVEDMWKDLRETQELIVEAIYSNDKNLNELQTRKEEISTKVKEITQRLIDQLKGLEND